MKESIKQELLHLFQSGQDQENYLLQHLTKDNLYHLSPSRFNLLAYFDFQSDMEVLELGGKSGILSAYVSELVKHVDYHETNPDYIELAHARLDSFLNVSIIESIQKKYDVVILVDAKNQYDLHTVLGYLKEGGILLLAFENRFGLRYINGGRDIHNGLIDQNYNHYYSKGEIEELLQNEKVSYQFYYPYPDEFFTKEIYSDLRLPSLGDLYFSTNEYERQLVAHFDEDKLREQIIQEGNFPLFSNSYLVEVVKK